MSWKMYNFTECSVRAIQLSRETQYEIMEALAKEVSVKKINHLLATVQGSSDPNCLIFDFRYCDSTKISNLRMTDYLIELTNGRYIVRTQQEFERYYYSPELDPVVPEDKRQTFSEAVVSFVNKYFPESGVSDFDDFTPEQLKQIMEGLKGWYDEDTDTFALKFTDCGIVDPTGMADVFSKFTKEASYFTPNTKFILDLNNGAYYADGGEDKYINLFNYIALQNLREEILKLDANIVDRLSGMTFQTESEDKISAIAPSVTPSQWQEFVTWATSVTGCTKETILR